MGETPEFVLTLVLTAAVLHALWNAMIKGTGERMIFLGLISLGLGAVGLVLIFLAPPPAAASWPYIAASTFIHFFYYAFLLMSYRLGDLSHVYPIARGIAPVLVGAGAFFFAGENLPPIAWGGIVTVSFGICILAWGSWRGGGMKAVGAALLTGAMIASYSVVDGIGARVSGSPLGYIGWLFLFEVYITIYVFFRERKKLAGLPLATYRLGLTGGLLSAAAYGLVIYAKTLAPMGAVSAVRESSVIVAALIGILFFREHPWQKRILASGIVVSGIWVLVAFS